MQLKPTDYRYKTRVFGKANPNEADTPNSYNFNLSTTSKLQVCRCRTFALDPVIFAAYRFYFCAQTLSKCHDGSKTRMAQEPYEIYI